MDPWQQRFTLYYTGILTLHHSVLPAAGEANMWGQVTFEEVLLV